MPLFTVENGITNEDVVRTGWSIARTATDTYLDLAQCTDLRLQPFIAAWSMATLRLWIVPGVAQQWTEEPLTGQIGRVLLSLHETVKDDLMGCVSPLPVQSFAFCMPLLRSITCVLTERPGSGRIDTKSCQLDPDMLSKVHDVLSVHAPLGRSQLLPRFDVLCCLIDIIESTPKLTRPAQTTLNNLACVISDSAIDGEVGLLLDGLMSPVPMVRLSCLQALEVSQQKW
jgi:hypothetical protein